MISTDFVRQKPGPSFVNVAVKDYHSFAEACASDSDVADLKLKSFRCCNALQRTFAAVTWQVADFLRFRVNGVVGNSVSNNFSGTEIYIYIYHRHICLYIIIYVGIYFVKARERWHKSDTGIRFLCSYPFHAYSDVSILRNSLSILFWLLNATFLIFQLIRGDTPRGV